MSRTFKDRPSKLRFPPNDNWVYMEDWSITQLPTTRPKKRKELNTEWQWLQSTPSWWNNLFHTRPIRGKFRNFCELAKRTVDLEGILEPTDSHKPHKYFY